MGIKSYIVIVVSLLVFSPVIMIANADENVVVNINILGEATQTTAP